MYAVPFVLALGALYLLHFPGSRVGPWRLAMGVLLPVSVGMSWCMSGSRLLPAPLWVWSLWLAWRLWRFRMPSGPGPRCHPRLAFAVGGLLSCCMLNLAQLSAPSRELPGLGGPHPVAKHQWVVQSSRTDSRSPDPFAKREFLVNVYYPTLVNARMARAPYLPAAMMLARNEGLDYFARRRSILEERWTWFDRDVLGVRSHAWRGFGAGLSPARDRYPVVIFSPGYGWFADMHSYQLEQIASHGYLVFAITHPGDTPRVEYPDGRRREWGWSGQALVEDRAAFESRQARRSAMGLALARQSTPPSPAQLHEMLSLVSEPTRLAPLADRSADVIELLDRLEDLNAGAFASQFAYRLDLANIAVTGMSYGGATASEACLDDQRCKAVVNLDGAEFGRLPFQAGTRPALWLYATDEDGRGWQDEFLRRVAYDRYAGPAYRVGLIGATHTTFADFPFWPREATLANVLLPGWLWTRDQRAIPPRILAYQLDFLDHYLKGKDLRLLQGGARREGAIFHARKAARPASAGGPPG